MPSFVTVKIAATEELWFYSPTNVPWKLDVDVETQVIKFKLSVIRHTCTFTTQTRQSKQNGCVLLMTPWLSMFAILSEEIDRKCKCNDALMTNFVSNL